MSFSPELGKIPQICRVFFEAKLVAPILGDLLKGGERDFYSDAARLLDAYGEHLKVQMSGTENILTEKGGLVVFNHPQTSTLLPSLSALMIAIKNEKHRNAFVVMGSEIPLFGRFNRYPVPFSIQLLERFHNMYPHNIISVPTARRRKDYSRGRVLAARHAFSFLMKGDIVMISPEGHVEIGNHISPAETLHSGSGELAILATKNKIPIYPVAIWGEGGSVINVIVGSPFGITTPNREEAANDLMRHVADLLPGRLRGPYAGG